MCLEKFYKNPKEPASFGGINALRRAVGKQVKTKDIKQWLETKDSYTLHKPARRNFKKNRVIVGDVFSKYAWAIPLKDKTGQSILKGFQNIFKERKPKSLQTDKGHAKALENGTAKYPLNRVLCKVYSVPQGSMSFVQDNIFVGQMPKNYCRMC
ncbi:uncharacterized transposon-derived protein F54H12.3 [Caerostris extrusa]|uniref:Uncharacterized transposon-derived protein F54H12.3 n=1 Tax=Caerostris extrusa TaxID=172846 RepID=A0AAV4XZK1_CAEEX|nr:uncharacterized transposon-derived protein F54H12.3 [Caerostris extrusa]